MLGLSSGARGEALDAARGRSVIIVNNNTLSRYETPTDTTDKSGGSQSETVGQSAGRRLLTPRTDESMRTTLHILRSTV